MKKKPLTIVLLSGLLFAIPFFITAQSVTIETINKNPAKYESEVVEIKGLVRQHVESNKTSTDRYILVGDEGGFIQVLTSSGLPETYKKYIIKGVLLKDADRGNYFVNEQSRIIAETFTGTSPVTSTAPAGDSHGKAFPLKTVLLIVGAVLIVLLIIYLIFTGRRKEAYEIEEESAVNEPAQRSIATEEEDDFKTIRVLSGAPKTLVFIPGKMKIISGEDTGKSFPIAAYPTPSGNIVTIGREKVSGEREYAHIQLKEKTVSRKQAELIQKENKLTVKNLSDTNYTQVDGVELRPGETAELNPNSTIRTGEVEFQYVV